MNFWMTASPMDRQVYRGGGKHLYCCSKERIPLLYPLTIEKSSDLDYEEVKYREKDDGRKDKMVLDIAINIPCCADVQYFGY